MTSFAFRVLVYLATFLFVVQCSQSEDSGREGTVDTGVCAFSPTDGELPSTLNKSFSVKASGYFDKRIITDHLDSLLQSSGRTIADYVRGQGVQLYRIQEKSESQCKFFAFLSSPTDAAQENWSNNANYDSDGNSFLLGLFTTYYVPVGPQEYTLQEPTIMVRQDTAKWTLLHEFSHYLFADARTRSPMEPRQILSDKFYDAFSQYNRNRRRFNNDPTLENGRRVINSLEEIYEVKHLLNQAGPLEEFTIEAMLFDRLRDQKLTQVDTDFDLRNALGYMNSNRKLVIRCYDRISDVAEDYSRLFLDNSWTELSERALNLKMISTGQRRFINEKMREAVDYYNDSLGTTVASLESLPRSENHAHIQFHHFDLNAFRSETQVCENQL